MHYSNLHQAITVCTEEFTCRPGMLLAVQKTSFPLSDLSTLFWSNEVVFTKSFDSLYVTIVEFIFSVEDKCQVMIAGGRQYDVVQERFICFPTVTTIDEGAKVTDDTGSENIRYRWCTINKKKKQKTKNVLL